VPVVTVVIPYDSRQAKNDLRDGADTIVGIAVRRPPECWHAPARRIMYDLHAPAELGDELFIGEGRHMLVGPCVYGNMVYGIMSTGAGMSAITYSVDH